MPGGRFTCSMGGAVDTRKGDTEAARKLRAELLRVEPCPVTTSIPLRHRPAHRRVKGVTIDNPGMRIYRLQELFQLLRQICGIGDSR